MNGGSRPSVNPHVAEDINPLGKASWTADNSRFIGPEILCDSPLYDA